MCYNDTAVRIENPLLEKCPTHATGFKCLHVALCSLSKGRADMALFTKVALGLGVGCLNLTYGIGQPLDTTGVPAIVT
jgi:hypothetical protein